MSERLITRRDFIRSTGAVLATTAALPLLAQQEPVRTAKAVLIRNQHVLDTDGNVQSKVLEQMFDEAVMQLFKVGTPQEAWKQIAKPSDLVGIKTNVWKYLRTPPELEQTMVTRLLSVGVDKNDISIDDRGIRSNPIFENATALINARPMRAHHWSGVGGCLKNYIMFVPKPSEYHTDSCVDLGAIWDLPHVKGKTKLNILVMLTPQFHCMGPHHFDKEYTWPYGGLLVGTDPVALDAIGLKIIEAKRKLFFKEDTPMRPMVTHIKAAEEKHGIGVADLSRIDIIKLGWKTDILI